MTESLLQRGLSGEVSPGTDQGGSKRWGRGFPPEEGLLDEGLGLKRERKG